MPFAKAYSGLSDAEMREVDAIIRRTTKETFGPVRSVEPTQVFELGFEGLSFSKRHKSGVAVRFPRMLRWRRDKPVEEADTLDNLRALAARTMADGRAAAIEAWLKAKGWSAFPFQRETWKLFRARKSGLLHATTGAGKTLAVGFGAWQAFPEADGGGLRVLWITPMRALAADSERSLRDALEGVAAAGGFAPWRVGARTGDTSTSERGRQNREPPPLLVTTPESLSLMLSREDARETFRRFAGRRRRRMARVDGQQARRADAARAGAAAGPGARNS